MYCLVYRMSVVGCREHDVNERPYVFRFCATKNLNSKKTRKKGKISVFSFGRGIVVGVRVRQ
jgi:hypothetical protein